MRLLSLRTVVAATDLTPASDPAIKTALRLAGAAGAALHVVHVAPSADLAADMTQREHYIQDVHAAVGRAGVAEHGHTVHILSGDAPTAISQLADRVVADLIILGRHRGGARPWHGALGSTAYEVITRARVPCLIITRPRDLAMQHVLVATDFSESARGALLMALSWASALRSREPGASEPEVLALHVSHETEAPDEPGSDPLTHELEMLRRSAGDWAGVCVHGATQRADDPVAGIVEYAGHHAADLVVLGTRGVRPAAGSDLGSVSAAAVQQLDVPVLLVPPAVWRTFAHDLDSP